MKKQLTMTTAMAAALMALPGCSSNEWDGDVVADRDFAVCVDEQGKRVEDYRCDNRSYGYAGGYGGGGHYWYYFDRNSRVPYYGDSIHDRKFAGGYIQPDAKGYYPAPASTNMTRSAAVSRGGLGSSGKFFGGGRS